MRVHAKAGEGKFHHIGAAHYHHTGGLKAGDHRGVLRGGGGAVQGAGAGAGDLAGLVEKVFHRHGDAGVAAGGAAGAAQHILRIGRGTGGFVMQHHEGRGLARHGGEALFQQGAGGGGAGGERLGRLFDGQHGLTSSDGRRHASLWQ